MLAVPTLAEGGSKCRGLGPGLRSFLKSQWVGKIAKCVLPDPPKSESLPILADSSEVCEEFLGVWIIPLPFPSCHSVTLVLSSLHVSLHLSPCHVLPIVQGFLPSAWLLKVPHLLLVSIRCGETGTLSFPSSISWLHLSVYFYIISFSFYLAIDGHLYCFCI